MLKAGGRCGVVIKNTFLSNEDNASVALRKQLLEECNLFAVLELPAGVFTGTTVKTVVLFFEKGTPTKSIWFYQLNAGRNFGKTTALTEADLIEFQQLQSKCAESVNSWNLSIESVDKNTWDLSPINPNKVTREDIRSVETILASIEEIDKEEAAMLAQIKGLL